MGPFETMHLNADGVEDYCKKYGANILNICESRSPSRPLSGSTLDVIKEAMERKVPFEHLNARRRWRDSRLAALAKGNAQESTYEHVHVVDLRSFVHNLILTITCLYLCISY